MRLPALVSRRLAMLTPDTTWRCEAEVLYMTDSAHARMSTLLDEIAPDVVVFELATYQFIHRAAVLTVRRRWRRLYRAASLVVGLVSRAGGGSELTCGKQECKAELRDVTHDEIGARDVKSFGKTGKRVGVYGV